MAVSTSWTSTFPLVAPSLPGSVLLLGVAHVIDLKAPLQRVLAEYSPTAVAVELDPERAQAMKERQAELALPPEQRKPRAKGGPLLFRLWAHLQERLAGSMGVLPGSEMLEVAEFARGAGLPTYLIDDPIRQTAPRLLASLSRKERLRLLLSTLAAFLLPLGWFRGSVEEYAQQRGELLETLRRSYPGLARVLVDERNEHMAQRLTWLSHETPRLAVALGDAHLPGISELLRRAGVNVRLLHLEELTRPAGNPPGGPSSAGDPGSPAGTGGAPPPPG